MRPADRILLGLLILDGLVVGLLSVGFCYLRFWGQPIPVVAVAAGILNVILLWLAARHTDGPLRFGPLVAWLIVVLVAAFGGPGGDAALYLGGTTVAATLILMVFGLGLPMALVWSGRLPEPDIE
ncbi:facilitated glucose transporter [Gordonia sp. VNQ95]|uniref:facilitated glucose transporter n=1 Tax=Gordonia sp. VNQ95 TaxID=3156619 RepID=UPI0032B3BD26